jgi:predicted metalloprotease
MRLAHAAIGRRQRLVRGDRRYRFIKAAEVGAACAVVLLASCSHTVLYGRAVSALYEPYRVGGLPATDGPSGPRANGPPPTGTVSNTDGGAVDRYALLAIDDIEDFWKHNYSDSLKGRFRPVSELFSYDSNDPTSPPVCGEETYQHVNALYCPPDDVVAWDRGVLLPRAKKYFGDMAINMVLAHEYGHAVQRMAGLASSLTPTLVKEQQADCFSGVYLRWVAEGRSRRFTLSTGDGLNQVLAGAIVLRDPIFTPEDSIQAHGTALDRIGAFQIGFAGGAEGCAGIDMSEINQRHIGLPPSLQVDSEGDLIPSQVPINNSLLSTLMELLGRIFAPANAPTLALAPANCPDAQPTKAASYCPATNTISVDLPVLQEMATPAGKERRHLPQGDNTAASVVTSRYTLALARERGLPLDSAVAALRTACLTGVAQRKMAEPIPLSSGNSLALAAGDLDEAVAGLLTNGLVASDVNGSTVPAGFTRILAFRSGLSGDTNLCYQRFSWRAG